MSKKILISALVIFTVISLLSLLLYYRIYISNVSNQSNQIVENKIPETLIVPPGSISLSVTDKNKSGRDLIMTAVIDSAGQSITSFDIDIRYNHDKLKFKKIESLVAGFDFHDSVHDLEDQPLFSEMILTGVKAAYNNEDVIFNQTPVAKIFFSSTGQYNQNDIKQYFKLNATDDSNLLNINSQEILGHVNGPDL